MTTEPAPRRPEEVLAGYQQRRLDLADMLRTLLHLARQHQDERREQEIRELLARLAAGRFELAVLGQFSRGKSTLMNALLGAPYLPMGALPTTSVVTSVHYGSRPRALVRSSTASLPVEVAVDELPRFVAQRSAERAELRVAAIDVELPADLLRLGFEFVDTPGVGSAIEANTATTLAYLRRADAVLFVTGFDSPLTSAEADFLSRAAAQAGQLFLVVNKRDLVTPAEAGDTADYVRQWVRAHLGLAEPAVFETSALQALHGAVAGDRDALDASGIGPLRDALTGFLTRERGRVLLRNVAAAAAHAAGCHQRDLTAGAAAAADPEALATAEAAFTARVGDILAQEGNVADRISAAAPAAVEEVFAARADAWRDELRATAGGREAGADEVLDALAEAGRLPSRAWLERRGGEVQEAVISRAADAISALLDLARSVRAAGAAVLAAPDAAGPGRSAGWAAADLPALPVPVLGWEIPDRLPAGRRERRLGGPAPQDAVAELVTAAAALFTEHARQAFGEAARRWATAVREHAARLTNSEADQFRRYLRALPSDDELAIVADLRDRLACLAATLEQPGSELTGPGQTGAEAPPPLTAEWPPAHRVSEPPEAECLICARLEALLSDYLRHDQFRLATQEAAQARHAARGGFCSLHSWQYTQYASPLGISAGYAKLAAATAAALEEAAAGATAAGATAAGATAAGATAAGDAVAPHIGARISDLVAGPGDCPACLALAEGEESALREVAARRSAAEAVPLCLPHLVRVLQTGAAAGSAAAMTRELAARLRRVSQDMRAYAAKREALQRYLITDEEASAYADAIRLLAGKPALAQPWLGDNSRSTS